MPEPIVALRSELELFETAIDALNDVAYGKRLLYATHIIKKALQIIENAACDIEEQINDLGECYDEADGMSIAKEKKVEEWLEQYRESHC